MASKLDRTARLAELERLIRPPRRSRGRTIGDDWAEHGLHPSGDEARGGMVGVGQDRAFARSEDSGHAAAGGRVRGGALAALPPAAWPRLV
jgi:hypothetical protein